jgi:hypothetical protein
MQTYNEGNAALTSTLIRTILESRRALRIAMSMIQERMQAATVMEPREESAAKRARSVSLPGNPKLELHQGTGTFALKRKPTPRTPLRLVSPFRHDSPLVMPGDTKYADADEHVEEPPPRERAEEEQDKPSESSPVR